MVEVGVIHIINEMEELHYSALGINGQMNLSFYHYFNMIAALIYSIMIVPTVGGNVSLTLRPMSEHPLHAAWLWCSLLSVFGVILNSLELFIFITERSSLVSSVNMMIMSVWNGN